MPATQSGTRSGTQTHGGPTGPAARGRSGGVDRGRGGRGGQVVGIAKQGQGVAQRGRGRGRGRSSADSSMEINEREDGRSPPPSDREEEDPEVNPALFTLENFEDCLSSWTEKQLREVLAKQTRPSNRIPPEVKEALFFHQMNYRKIKLMLALIGNVSEKMVNDSVGEGSPPRKISNWNRYVAFSVESSITPVPPKGCSIGWEERNVHLGQAWKALSSDEQDVFDRRIFRYFSKIPTSVDDEEDDPDCEEVITPVEEALYRPLYQRLINHEKIDIVAGQSSELRSGIGKRALRHILRINSELFTVSNLYNLTFYLLSATRSPGTRSFCEELSNDATWLQVTKKKWSAKENFEAYSHGRDIQQIIEKFSDKQPLKQPKGSDILRSKLRVILNDELATALGCETANFPKQKDPVSKLATDYPTVMIVRSEDSKLGIEALALGLEAMNTAYRKLWLQDLKSGAFQILPNAEAMEVVDHRTNLRKRLNELLASALGCETANFPKQKDPESQLPIEHPTFKIIQSEDSKSATANLAVGLDMMTNHYIKLWFDDVESGAFQIVADEVQV
ncbi:hypothetical protein PSTT_03231 [Puccinia striiformis]|uniref:Uncharacterized protein n=1 Tax=Puccinia striiformis TaxID=27350 RepID=A0A2S4VX92_9BASI|nr:hypothetical protein PSTT_03231 [Puccinia striiformis]